MTCGEDTRVFQGTRSFVATTDQEALNSFQDLEHNVFGSSLCTTFLVKLKLKYQTSLQLSFTWIALSDRKFPWRE